jgi:hypothetical protein
MRSSSFLLPQKAFRLALLAIAIISYGIGVMSLRSLQRQEPESGPFWKMPDTAVYFSNATALKQGQPLGKMFRDRLVLPFLLFATHSTNSNPWPYLYLQQVPHFFAPLLLAGIANCLFKKRRASLFAAILYVAYSPAREASRIISTDYIHAFFFIVAVYWTLRYWKADSWSCMLASATGWILAMLSRPTFMLEWGVMVPMAIWQVWKKRIRFDRAICHCALLLLVPCFFACLNFIQCGVPTVSFASFENIHCSLVPSIQTALRNQKEGGLFSKIFAEQVVQQKASRNNAWSTLELWQSTRPINREEFATTYRQLQTDDREYVVSHWRDAFKLVKGESGNLLFASNMEWCGGSRGRNLFVLSALTGLLFVWHGHKQRITALWLLLTLGLVLGPASCAIQLWWGRRVGLPADFLFLALAGGALVSWRCMAFCATFVAGFKLLNFWNYDPCMNAAILVFASLAIFEGLPWGRRLFTVAPVDRVVSASVAATGPDDDPTLYEADPSPGDAGDPPAETDGAGAPPPSLGAESPEVAP